MLNINEILTCNSRKEQHRNGWEMFAPVARGRKPEVVVNCASVSALNYTEHMAEPHNAHF